ncbi:helix-turn-helix domain-containing protein [Cupriavidus pinatubonensis]|uniref:HTH cro/C1-type domain-containing protein n=2 Tax=Cupriavidus pinatubonensis TaxID=248026 RepID=A0ABM8WR30_9BURK|nr:helix-turn-helix transcriptional regulator [Cupriavidus pinatubonensis]CAG9169911.1 hypothetical protein LMG23994_01725 [Cupriavidus pinatubonensis]
MGAQALAHEIANAVAADEAGDGCDIAAGIFGPKMSALIRKIVTEYLGATSKPHATCPTPVDETEAAEREHMGCVHCGTGIYTSMSTASEQPDSSAAVAAIQFALTADEGMEYLRCWNQGEFDACRREWPEASSDCYIGADPLYARSQTSVQTEPEGVTARRPMTVKEMAAQYETKDGEEIHIGSGPPKATCPCGLCTKVRRQDGAQQLQGDERDAEEHPSFTNPLTPYGMLVRALRIVAGTSLRDMAQYTRLTPSQLSALEFGRTEYTQEHMELVARYFFRFAIDTRSALVAAIQANKEARPLVPFRDALTGPAVQPAPALKAGTVTPAMRGWLEHIGSGREISRTARFATGPYSTTGRGGLTYVMVGKLEDAGLIEWVPGDPLGTIPRVFARLTDAGRAAIQPKKGKRNAG